MSKVLVIGAGGVGSVAVHKMAQLPEVFSSITLASRRLSSCEKVARSVKERFGVSVETGEVDADEVAQTVRLIERVKPDPSRAISPACLNLSWYSHCQRYSNFASSLGS